MMYYFIHFMLELFMQFIAVNDRKHLYLKCLIWLKNKSELIMLLAEYKMTSFISSEYFVYTCRSTTAQYITLDFTIHVE